MDELWLYNKTANKRICQINGGLKTYEEILTEAGIPIADVMIDKDGLAFTMNDLCVEVVHCDFI